MLDDIESATNRRPQFFRIGDRSLAKHAHALREFREIDVGTRYRCAGAAVCDPAAVPVSHDLNLHDFLMVGPVVVHDVQHRNAVVRGRPQDSRGVHQIAVVLNIHGQPAIFAVCECGAHRGWRPITNSIATCIPEVLILFVKVP